MSNDINSSELEENVEVNDGTLEEVDDNGDVASTVSDDYKAYTDRPPVKKVSKYGLTNTSKQLTRVYNSLFNRPAKMPEQIVYFGAPGTGKSFNIDKRLKKMRINPQYISRVIFHPDYTYGDFVGCIKPKKDDSGIDYLFEAGPLTRALITAFENPDKDIYIIIEEINRGNAAAIFGDLFQLLDRDDSGKSKYKITNKEICSVICKNAYLSPFFKLGEVWFPNNLNFLCTMNTADQNVFILDSAFKRRFHMKYVPINQNVFDGNPKLADYAKETSVFCGSESLVDLFKDTELSSLVNDLNVKGKLLRNWPTFAVLVNALIDCVNANEGEQISEDKKLGPFYVLKDELDDREKFADKVIYYLKQDVFKYIDNYFMGSYQKIYTDYTENGLDVFKLLLSGEN